MAPKTPFGLFVYRALNAVKLPVSEEQVKELIVCYLRFYNEQETIKEWKQVVADIKSIVKKCGYELDADSPRYISGQGVVISEFKLIEGIIEANNKLIADVRYNALGDLVYQISNELANVK